MPVKNVPRTVDIYPITIRGPLALNRSKLSTFARLFVHEGRLYIAESRDKGRTVANVTSYPLPEGKPVNRGGTKAGRWGDWSWSGCGCANSWRRHSVADLVALDETVTAPPVTGSNPHDWPSDAFTDDLI